MAQILADRRDIDFVLYEQFKVDELAKNKHFADFNRKAVDLIVNEARNLAVKEILPTQVDGDRIGAHFANGAVTMPQSFHKAWKALTEGEWLAMSDDPEWGGQGMPHTVASAATDYLMAANFAFMLTAGLTHGAGKLVEKLGTQKQKDLYLKKIYSGEWGGTMLLTEADAGSDVGALTATATLNPDGTYSITGNKIFISAGEHDLVENIIHPVLARIEGAPAGTAGISMFLVPKYRVNDDGSLGEFNDVVCTGIEEKMGIHGNATCSLSLGSKGQCIGTLLGEPNKGMRGMFMMMNEARLMVGAEGLACASASYLYAVNYARTRVQSRHLLKGADKSAPSVAIIQHPDVRRMLMVMKSYVEGMRSLGYFISHCMDRIHIATNADEKARTQAMVDLLIPVAKGYVTDRAFQVCSLGVQVYGGYGYCREFPVEQLLRDVRITAIYEGTNGIQALDLIGRKLSQNNGQAIQDLFAQMKDVLNTAQGLERVAPIAARVAPAIARLEATAAHMTATMQSDPMTGSAHAFSFLEAVGDMVMGWMLLWRANVAAAALKAGAKEKDAAFYEGQIMSADFFSRNMLPVTLGHMETVLGASSVANDISEDAFGGK
ncbi:acyl-CoA dehydrogenase [Geothrix sp. PMB-07]|uniref:acyl-CoA dehydrogenase n=1 Tax=Geothrix sp. PMB-07 TaxID=3068640 RepID=UPI0027414D7F|nr:acyl-CoA dehydrogenase [Geothrix sp. PMB-07]WLT31631.1 acyl-CoA dehydrogenase [Geothrix sp. PMB-07]